MAGMIAGEHSNRFEHQVFLSFRRSETGSFVGHLFNALRRSGLRVFMDSDGVEHGDDIKQKLYEAIEHSEMSVVILSGGFADSHWYLDELVKIMDLEALGVHSVLPVFFKVEPTDVRKQKGVYANAFEELEKLHEGSMAKWRTAMKRTADLKGLSLNSERDESKLVRDIIEMSWKIVNTSLLDVPSCIVGRDSILEELNMWLQDGSTDIEVGVIYGLGGIGKSTIAKIAYNRNTRIFDGCSFLANIKRKTAQPDGLACVLEQVISDVTGNQGNKIYNVDKGLSDVRAILCRRKVLLVLDDVDEVKNFPSAFVDSHFLGRGSKIIITTRNESLRKVSFFKRKFRVGALQFEESKKLLKLHARVDSDDLSQRQEELLCEFLQHCQGIPLALYIMGPLLRIKSEQAWEKLLAQMKGYEDKRIFNVFRLSFDCIDNKYTKELFLFIACFFVGLEKGYALKILEACKLRPILGLENLVNRCLVSIDYDGKLMMHQSIEDMGKEVARQESIDEPGKRSKLWSTDDSKSVLQDFKGTSIIRGLRLELPKPTSMHKSFEISMIGSAFNFLKPWKQEATLSSIRTSSFTMISNLDLLLLNHVQFSGGFEYFPKKMKWLRWPSCPLQYIQSNFTLDELVVLDMRRSSLVRAWKGSKRMNALRVLDLSYSDCLVCTPDLSHALALECLFLEGCVSLAEVHESIGKLTNLVHLNLKGCESLVKVHSSVEALEKLTILNLKGCKNLTSFPFPSSLKQLNLAECTSYFEEPMEQSDLSPTSPSKILSMAYPLKQDSVRSTSPFSLFTFYLPALKELNLVGCGIARDDVLELLSCAPSLEELNLRDNPLRSLSNNKDLRPCLKLKYLSLRRCTKLQSVSDLPPSCNVNAEICYSLKRISFLNDPDSIPSVFANGCKKLAEVDYGFDDRLVMKGTNDMGESQASLFGFGSILAEDHKGFFRAGTYQVYLLGNHLANYFTTTVSVSVPELWYTVPCTPADVRAINLGFEVSAEDFGFDINYVRIENLTGLWEWTLHTPSTRYLDTDYWEVMLTWLSHWCVMEHRVIKPGDLLKVSLDADGLHSMMNWGIEVIFDEQREKCFPVLYKNTFLYPLPDLSMFEAKNQIDNIDDDQNDKVRKYDVPRPPSL